MHEEAYEHTPLNKMYSKDYYGISYDEERASRKKITLGIIGTGGISQSKHIPAINRLITIWEQIELVAFSVRSKEQGEKVSKIYNCKWYSNYKEMIKNENLDGVIIATPDKYHYEHTMDCLEAGINVLLEKPFTYFLSQGKKLCKYAEEKNLVLMVVSNKRYCSAYKKAKKFVDNGPVKDPALFCGKFNHGLPGGHHFEDATVHVFDLSRYFMGDISEIYTIGINKYKKSNYPMDNSIVNFKFKSDSIGSIYTTSTALCTKPWERVEIYADHSWLSVEDQSQLTLYDSEEGPAKSWKPVISSTLVFDEEIGGYMGLIENFTQAIRGSQIPIAKGWDGYKALEIAVASHLSLKNKKVINLPLDPESADKELKEWLDYLKDEINVSP